MYKSISNLTVILFFSMKSLSQVVTNVSDKVSSVLFAYGKVNVTRNTVTRVRQCEPALGEGHGSHCEWENRNVPVTTQEYLQSTQINTIKISSLEFGQDSLISLPDKFVEATQDFINTSSINSTQSQSLSVSFTRSSSITFSSTITNSTKANVGFQLRLSNALAISGGVEVGTSETNGTTSIDGNQTTVTHTSMISVNLPARTAVHASLREWTIRHKIKFKCMVTIDANISSNDAGIAFLSQIEDEQARTFMIDGIIIVDDCTDGVTTQSDPIILTSQQTKDLQNAKLRFN